MARRAGRRHRLLEQGSASSVLPTLPPSPIKSVQRGVFAEFLARGLWSCAILARIAPVVVAVTGCGGLVKAAGEVECGDGGWPCCPVVLRSILDLSVFPTLRHLSSPTQQNPIVNQLKDLQNPSLFRPSPRDVQRMPLA